MLSLSYKGLPAYLARGALKASMALNNINVNPVELVVESKEMQSIKECKAIINHQCQKPMVSEDIA
jgi:hypothetical protein